MTTRKPAAGVGVTGGRTPEPTDQEMTMPELTELELREQLYNAMDGNLRMSRRRELLSGYREAVLATAPTVSPSAPADRAALRDLIAEAIWERQNPGRRYADCEYRWRADTEADADAVLTVLRGLTLRELEQLYRPNTPPSRPEPRRLAAEAPEAEPAIVAYRNPHRPGVLLCREHGDGRANLTPLASEDLPDGGICAHSDCGADVLIAPAAGSAEGAQE